MANKSISQLTAGSAISGTDIFPDVQTAGVGPVKVTATQLATYFWNSPTLVTPNLGVATATSINIGGATLGTNVLAYNGSAIGTSLALGGATIGTNNLAVTGTTALAGATTVSTGGLTIGVAGTTGGTIALKGSTAGTLTLQVPATVTDYSITFPSAVAAANGYILTSTTAGVTSWTNPTALGVDLDIGTTAITGGTTTRVLYNNAGVLGEYAITGTGSVVLGTTPTFTTSALFPAGTVSDPGIAVSGDTNTGIYFPAADTIGFVEGGVESMRIDASGNLGLGVTPSAWNTYKAIEIGTLGSSLAATSGQTILTNNAYYQSNWKYAATGLASFALQINGEHRFYNAPSGTAGNPITFTQAMTLDASGNLGIGTPSPATLLDIRQTSATFRIGGDANDTGTIQFFNTTSSSINATISGNLEGGNAGGDIRFATKYVTGSLTEKMRIDSNGNVLVGGTAARGTTVGAAHLDIFNGTAPVGTLTNGISLYSSSGDFYFMDAAGSGYQVGYRNIPQNAQTSAYVAVVGDVGKHIDITTGGVTVNASVFSVGDVFTIYNDSGSSQDITAGSGVTFRLAGTATSGTPRTVAQYGLATVLCVTGGASPVFVLSGAGVA
jgi:hypothetical protein